MRTKYRIKQKSEPDVTPSECMPPPLYHSHIVQYDLDLYPLTVKPLTSDLVSGSHSHDMIICGTFN